MLAQFIDGVSPEFRAHHSTLAQLRAGKPQWQKLFDREDAVTSLAVQGDRAYVLSHKGAPRYQLLGAMLDGFSMARARVLVPQSERVLSGLAAAADAVYLEQRDGNVKRLSKLAYRDDAQPAEVNLPVVGAFTLGSGVRSDVPGLLLDLESWTRARQIFAVATDGRVSNTGLQPAGPFDAPGNVVATEVMVKSHDGVMVPMSIIHKAGVKPDGSNPTLLYGYASYGITEEPFFSLSRLAWMDAGGVFAVANPRGSGVFGKQWHEDGRLAKKPNTWRDFIACAEVLVAQGWTRPSRLAMSTYHQVKDGVNYPAVLFTHGVNDPRVEVWNSTKTAARLLAASKSGKPVLLRLDYDSGHGIGSTKTQVLDERADLFAFTLWQMGVPGFELK